MDTPEGPFYRVVRATPKSFWIDAAEVGKPIEVRFGKSPRKGVRVAI